MSDMASRPATYELFEQLVIKNLAPKTSGLAAKCQVPSAEGQPRADDQP